MISREVNRLGLRTTERLHQVALYAGGVVAAAIMGAFIALHDALSELRMLMGLPVIAVWLRYPYTLLLGWALIDPFIGSNVPIFNGKNLDTALTVPVLLLMTMMPVRETLKRVPALVLLLIFFFWMLLGINVSPLDHGAFLKEWIGFIDYVAVAVLATHLLSTRRRMTAFMNILLVVPTGVALYGIYGYVTHQNVMGSGTGPARITSVFSDAPTLALFFSTVIPLALYRVLTARKIGRLIALMSLCTLLAAVGLTFTRGAIISVGLCLVIVVPLLPTGRMKLGVLGLAALVALTVAVSGVSLFARFSGSDVATLNGRTTLWQALLDNFDPTQIIGNGLGAGNALLKGLEVGGTGLGAASPSNLYIGTLYDQGIIGLTLLMLTFLVLAMGLIQGMRRAIGEHRVLFLTALVTLVGVLVQSIEVNDFFAQGVGIYFWMVVALPFARRWAQSGSRSEAMAEPREEAMLHSVLGTPAGGGSAAER